MASVLEDGLIGLVHVLGYLWCSTLQGQLQGERGRGESTHPQGSSSGGTQGEGRESRYQMEEHDMPTWPGGSCSWGRCEVKQRGWPSKPAGWGPNILAAHTPAVSLATRALLAGIVTHELEAARSAWPSTAPGGLGSSGQRLTGNPEGAEGWEGAGEVCRACSYKDCLSADGGMRPTIPGRGRRNQPPLHSKVTVLEDAIRKGRVSRALGVGSRAPRARCTLCVGVGVSAPQGLQSMGAWAAYMHICFALGTAG